MNELEIYKKHELLGADLNEIQKIISDEKRINQDDWFVLSCGDYAFNAKRFKDAIIHYDNFIRSLKSSNSIYFYDVKLGLLKPRVEFVKSYIGKAMSFYELGQFESSSKTYLELLDLSGFIYEAALGLSCCQMNLDEVDKAIVTLNEIRSKVEVCPQVLYYLGTCYYKQESLEIAKSFFILSAEQGDEESKKILNDWR